MDFLGNIFGGLKNLFGGMGGGSKAVAPSFARPSSGQSSMLSAIGGPNQFMPKQSGGASGMGAFSGLLDSFFPGGKAQGIAGLAIPAMSQFFGPKSPQAPDINSLQSVKALQQFQPGKSVSPEYQEMLQGNVGRLRDKRIRDLQAVYRSSRPGTDYTTDTNYQRDLAETERGVQEQLSSDLASAEATFSGQEQNRLSEIAQMDVYSIMEKRTYQAETVVKL